MNLLYGLCGCSAVRQCAAVWQCAAVRQCVAVRAAVYVAVCTAVCAQCAQRIVYSSAIGSVWQYTRQRSPVRQCGSVPQCGSAAVCGTPAVHEAVCGSACGSVRLSSSLRGIVLLSVSAAVCDIVRQCAAVCVAVCGNVRSSVCAAVRATVCGSASGSVQLSCSVRGSVRLTSGAAVCSSAATRCFILYHIRTVDASLPPPAPRRSQYYIHMLCPALSCNPSLCIISYTGCRRQTAPSCTTSLTLLYPYAVACPLLQPVAK
jgi:hypothetical protein